MKKSVALGFCVSCAGIYWAVVQGTSIYGPVMSLLGMAPMLWVLFNPSGDASH